MDYRKLIYASYGNHLDNSSNFKKFDKEKRAFDKYFKLNYLKHLPEDKGCKILDIGCGKGTFLLSSIKYGYKNVEGIDVSEENIDFCRKQNLKCLRIDGITFLKENLGIYDVIIFNDVIEHLTKNEIVEMLLAIKDALKNEGIIIIKSPNMANPYTSLASLYIDFTHETGFTELSLKQLLGAIRFSSVSIFGSDIYIPISNKSHFQNHFQSAEFFYLSKMLLIWKNIYKNFRKAYYNTDKK